MPMTPHPQPGYLAPSARSQEWIQQTLAGRQQLRVIALRASPSHLARIPESTLPAAAREAFAARTAHESQNMEKNRYGDIAPYDPTRVLLASGQRKDPSHRYVNASWISEPHIAPGVQGRTWIAAQAPIRETVHDFLSLFLEPLAHPSLPELRGPSPRTIVMLTACVEGGRAKSYRYWPEYVGDKLVFDHYITSPPSRPHHCADWSEGYLPPITVEYVACKPSSEADAGANKGWRTNVLRLSQTGRTPVKINQIEYLGWQDHGIPDSPDEILRLLEHLNAIAGAKEERIVTHCSAGVGRTGSLISIAWLVPLLARIRSASPDSIADILQGVKWSAERSPLGPLPFPHPDPTLDGKSALLAAVKRAKDGQGHSEDGFDPIMAIIDGCRDQRTTMVQTAEQVDFVYRVAALAWERGAN